MPIAIVTGANSGIGRGTALALARRGFDLGLTWHSDEENLEEAVAECEAEGVRVEHRQVDLSAVPGPDAVIDELTDALGGLDALVANAAAGHSTPFLEVELEEWERKGVPLGRPGDANEIGAAAAFLASEASYITGETLVVDGGMNLMAAMANQLAQ